MQQIIIYLLAIFYSSKIVLCQDEFPFIPKNSQLYLGAWPEADDGYNDDPVSMNSRLSPLPGLSVYQVVQTIPVTPYSYVSGAGGTANLTGIEATQTDTSVYLTIYLADSATFETVTDQDYQDLATQIKGIQDSGRKVFLRYLPEMNGNWFPYGGTPVAFVDNWRRMHGIVKQFAPETVIIWAPNYSLGYPYGMELPENVTEAQALDTNGDGLLTNEDDAYASYYPGNGYVDWNGISIYYKGPGFQDQNAPNSPSFCEQTLIGNDPYYDIAYTPFYDTYCQEQDTPCWLAEIGAAYQVNITDPTGATQLEVQQAWYRSCVLNNTFFDAYPNIKGIMLFEFEKVEESNGELILRDFRLTNASDILDAFKEDLEANKDRFIWASDLDDTDKCDDCSKPTLHGDNAISDLSNISLLSCLAAVVVTITALYSH